MFSSTSHLRDDYSRTSGGRINLTKTQNPHNARACTSTSCALGGLPPQDHRDQGGTQSHYGHRPEERGEGRGAQFGDRGGLGGGGVAVDGLFL